MKAQHELHNDHRLVWQSKPALREVYSHYYKRIVQTCLPGRVLEIGGGSGNLKEFIPDILSSDISYAPWLDFIADAQNIPLMDESISNIVMLDVLHHIEFPKRFFSEAERVLKLGGKIIMVEPGITPLSWPFYRYLHNETVDMTINPLIEGLPNLNKDPYSGNQAVPTLLVTRFAHKLQELFPELRTVKVEWLSLVTYPLSGGFKPWSLIGPRAARSLLLVEDLLSPLIGRLFGFRIMIVIEKVRCTF